MKKKIIGIFVCTLLIATTGFSVAMTMNKNEVKTFEHDVGVTEIISPTSGPLQSYPVSVKVKNYGSNSETTGVQVDIIEMPGGTPEYVDLAEDVDIPVGQEVVVDFSGWMPSDIGEYQVTACTLLDDENASNDCISILIYISETFMGLEVYPLGDALLDIGDDMRVWNLDDDGDDGVMVDLPIKVNSYRCTLEDPFVHEMNASVNVAFNGFMGEEPFSGSMIFKDREDKSTQAAQDNALAEKIITFDPDDDIVFHAEVGEVGDLGYIVEQSRGVFPTGFTGSITGEPSNYSASMAVFWADPAGVLWTWEEHDVYNLTISKLMVVYRGEGTGEAVLSDFSINTTRLDEFTMLEHYAYELDPPAEPNIDGPTSGKNGTEYTYAITNTGTEDVYFFVDWDDGTPIDYTELTVPAGTAPVSHTWEEQGTYTVKTRAMDEWGAMSDWGTLEVTMPKNKPFNFNFNLVNWLFERFPNMFPILRYLLGL